MHRALRLFALCFPAIVASILLAVAGCAAHPSVARPRKQVEITSTPPGAKIEVNGLYVGDAPLTVNIETTPNGRFWRDTIIKAYPADKGFTQIRAYNGARHWSISDTVPSEIGFNTRLEPSAGLQQSQ
jgi:PEGA domain